MRFVEVSLGARSYRILIGAGLLATIGRECAGLGLSKRCAVITDDHVGPLYLRGVTESLRGNGFEPAHVVVPAGEASKRVRVVESCYEQLAAHRLERKSFVVALGGGVVGDLAGFVAASYLRGIPFVQVPTTLLAQVDSSVGGKVGVNLKAGKNLVGSFHQPRLVICDVSTLTTLPDRELKAGLAEVIKYGIIHDASLFRKLEKNLDRLLSREQRFLSEVIARSCEIKAEVVAKDETETGPRAILNYGHTIGHAIEAVFGYGKYLHGEAISIGQVAASRISTLLTGLPEKDAERIRAIFDRAGLPVTLPTTPALRKRLILAMRSDKKVKDGEVKFVLARSLGSVDYGLAVPEREIERALEQACA